jgi:hypothetical protein
VIKHWQSECVWSTWSKILELEKQWLRSTFVCSRFAASHWIYAQRSRITSFSYHGQYRILFPKHHCAVIMVVEDTRLPPDHWESQKCPVHLACKQIINNPRWFYTHLHSFESSRAIANCFDQIDQNSLLGHHSCSSLWLWLVTAHWWKWTTTSTVCRSVFSFRRTMLTLLTCRIKQHLLLRYRYRSFTSLLHPLRRRRWESPTY